MCVRRAGTAICCCTRRRGQGGAAAATACRKRTARQIGIAVVTRFRITPGADWKGTGQACAGEGRLRRLCCCRRCRCRPAAVAVPAVCSPIEREGPPPLKAHARGHRHDDLKRQRCVLVQRCAASRTRAETAVRKTGRGGRKQTVCRPVGRLAQRSGLQTGGAVRCELRLWTRRQRDTSPFLARMLRLLQRALRADRSSWKGPAAPARSRFFARPLTCFFSGLPLSPLTGSNSGWAAGPSLRRRGSFADVADACSGTSPSNISPIRVLSPIPLAPCPALWLFSLLALRAVFPLRAAPSGGSSETWPFTHVCVLEKKIYSEVVRQDRHYIRFFRQSKSAYNTIRGLVKITQRDERELELRTRPS